VTAQLVVRIGCNALHCRSEITIASRTIIAARQTASIAGWIYNGIIDGDYCPLHNQRGAQT